MTPVLVLSLFWIVYGVLGLFGIQIIPRQMKGTEQERAYKRYAGTIWLLLGVPLLLLYFATRISDTSEMPMVAVTFGAASPAMVYAVVAGRKFQAALRAKPKRKDGKK